MVETCTIAGLRTEKLTLAEAQRTQRQEVLGNGNCVFAAKEIDSDLGDLGGLARANPDDPPATRSNYDFSGPTINFSFSKITVFLRIALASSIALGALFSSTTGARELDTYGGFTDIKGKKTGFFHAEKIDNRWWLVTPEGHGFWGIGMAHPITDFTQSAVTFVYGGDQEAWLRDGIRKLRDLGYNCAWSGPYSTERNFKGYVDLELARRVYLEEKFPHSPTSMCCPSRTSATRSNIWMSGTRKRESRSYWPMLLALSGTRTFSQRRTASGIPRSWIDC